MLRLSPARAEEFCRMGEALPGAAEHLASDVVVAMELVAEGAVAKWQAMMGPEDPAQAKMQAPRSIRALFGSDAAKNAVHGSESPVQASAEIDFFFGGKQHW